MGKVKEYYFAQLEELKELKDTLNIGNYEEYEELKRLFTTMPVAGMTVKKNGLIDCLPTLEEELPRDFDLNFIDPIGDIDERSS